MGTRSDSSTLLHSQRVGIVLQGGKKKNIFKKRVNAIFNSVLPAAFPGGIKADAPEEPRRRTFSTMNRAFNRKKGEQE